MNAYVKTSSSNSVNSSSPNGHRILGLSDQMARATASDIFQQLQDQGYHARDIISVSTQLIDLITQHITTQK